MSFPCYPAYKDSGIEWLGEMPKHWHVLRLGQVGRLEKGNGGNKQDEADAGVPCVRYGDLYTVHRHFIRHTRSFLALDRAADYTLVQFGDVLFAASGETLEEIGKSAVNLIPGEVRCGGDVILLRPTEKIDPVFSGYALDNPFSAAQKARMGRGFTVVHIYGAQLRNLVIPLPPAPEQVAIAAFLDRETAKIDALVSDYRALIELLQEKRQAVISHAVTKGLDPKVPMKDSGVEWLGEVPKHWRVVRLKFVATVQTGVAKGKDNSGKAVMEVPYLRVANVQDGYLDLSNLATIEIPADDLDRYTLQPGDVLMNEGGDYDKLGRGHVWEGEVSPCIHQNHVFAVRPTGVSPSWLNRITGSNYAQFYFMSRSKQSTNLASISSTNIMELPVLLPPEAEREAIVTFLERETAAIDSLITDAQGANALLQERRTALISAAVTGKIDVRGLVDEEAA
jgi:type I restriction enzyme S subunit